jgi:hypothetical protein
MMRVSPGMMRVSPGMIRMSRTLPAGTAGKV